MWGCPDPLTALPSGASGRWCPGSASGDLGATPSCPPPPPAPCVLLATVTWLLKRSRAPGPRCLRVAAVCGPESRHEVSVNRSVPGSDNLLSGSTEFLPGPAAILRAMCGCEDRAGVAVER